MRGEPRRHGGRHAREERARQDSAAPQWINGLPGQRQKPASDGAGVLQAIYDQHHAHLMSYALRLTDEDSAHAEAIVKEALYRAWQDPGALARPPSALRPRLVMLTRAVYLEGARDAGEADPGSADGEAIATELASSAVLAALRTLSSVHRSVLIDVLYRRMSIADVASTQHVPVETVKSRLYYALRALRVVLQDTLP